jgi:cytochrome c oxidase subunit II
MNRSSGSAPRTHWRRVAIVAGVGALALAAAACDNPQTAWIPASDYANEGKDLFQYIIYAGIIVGVLVEGALIFAAIRFRRRPSDGLPPQIHGNTLVEVTWTTVPAIVLLTILVPTIQTIFRTQAPAPSDAFQVHVVGHQFWWEFQYPNSGVVTADEIHLPVDKTVNLQLNSADVIHSFWVPALGGKRDAFPAHTNFIWLTPDTVGEFPGQCFQLCGYSHGNMRMKAFVQSQSDFDAWLANQQQPAVTPPPGSDAEQGMALITSKGCIACHTINGTSAQGTVGPNLTHLATRTTIAGGTLPNTTEGLHTWLQNPPAVKPGSIMPNLNLSEDEIRLLTAYLQSLT